MKKRTRAVGIASSALLAASLMACGTANETVGSSSGDTITIGVIAPLTGPLAQSGQDMVDGAQVAVDQINADGGINGKQVEIITKDDGGTAQQATQAARDLANDGHRIIVGGLSSIECGAIKSAMPAIQAVYVATTCVDPEVTGLPGQPGTDNVYRTGVTNVKELGYVKDQATIIHSTVSGITSWDYFGFDYTFGHEQQANFQNNLSAITPPPTMASSVFAPVDSQNFRPYVSQLASGMTDAPEGRSLFLGTYGGGTASFFQQAASFDFLSKYKMIFTTGDVWSVLISLNGAFPNLWDWYTYVWGAFDTDVNKAFVNDYRAAHDRMPGGQSNDTYNGMQAVFAAIEKAGSADYDKVSEALAGLSYEGTQGTRTIDATTHQADTVNVLANLAPDPSAPDGIKVVQTVLVHPDGTTEPGKSGFELN